MMRRETASRFFWPCIMPENLARFVFSQSCSWFFCVVSLQVDDHLVDVVLERGDLALRLDGDADRVRSPLVTAVATSEMART